MNKIKTMLPLLMVLMIVLFVPTLTEATMCQSVDAKTLAPIGKTDTFPPDFREMNCSIKVNNAPAKTLIKAQFLDPKKAVMAESSLKVEGTEYVHFRMVRGKDLWAEGSYSVVIYVNDKQQLTVPFTIQIGIPQGLATFTEPTICSKIDLNTKKPLDTANAFAPDFEVVYLSVKLNNAPADTEVAVQWLKPDGSVITETKVKYSGTGYIGFSITRTGDPWALGTYSAALFMDGKADVIVNFVIK